MPSDHHSLEALKIDKRAKDGGRMPWVAWVLLVLLAAGAVFGFWYARRARIPQVQAVRVEQPQPDAAASAVLNASGYVTARRRATVSSKVTGRVVEVMVEEGMPVRKGQVLARLDASTVEKYLALAQAELEATRRAVAENRVRLAQAKLNLQRFRQLRADGIANQADLDAAETEVAALDARLALSEEQVRVSERQVAVRQTDLADTTIVAPFDGVAISKDAQPGEMVSPVSAGGGFTRTGISTIVDMSSLEIEVDVNESYIHRVAPGQRVEAVLDAYPDWRIPAKVITMVPAADRQKATVLVRIGFDRLDPRLLPDMGVKVAFLGAEAPRPSAAPPILVPKAAVKTVGSGRVAFVVGSDGRVEQRAIRVGQEKGDRVEILAGLTPGEQIVTESPVPLSGGIRVVVK